ncbi:hypothetical protein CEE37_11105 [candidate division LCP-89 bacterium B3_LCP]|uniref:Secretion system C-terminal sorting domain-containing protein n=1 Tax=candidate division LCP-89 bacterium B3_LCP TaxID=2012998 RepID=A0A532UYJ7_UNCL8|nr:MAG: hypothetical protein CEE37_11105 [candidate division LCP-89 bacterium B3_LCP]
MYVTGTNSIDYANCSSDYITIKYNNNGVEQWLITYNGLANGNDEPTEIVTTDNLDIYITGHSSPYPIGGQIEYDYCTIKYSQSGPPMPVELVGFDAEILTNGVELNWQTASEMDCYGWKVERRQGDEQYQDISPLIPGNGTTEEPHNYSYIDQTTQTGETYEYRLEQIDIGGSITFSDPIMVSLPPLTAGDFHLFQNSPNPFNATTVISFSLPVASMVQLDVFDVTGARVGVGLAPTRPYTPGTHQIKFDGSGLPSGIYLYRLTASGSGATPTMKVGKMVLLK